MQRLGKSRVAAYISNCHEIVSCSDDEDFDAARRYAREEHAQLAEVCR